MNQVCCFKHPKYDGRENPPLNCQSCCSVFIARIRTMNEKRAETVAAWLEAKQKAVRRAAQS